MGDFSILRVLDLFRPIFEKFGFDYKVLRRILQVKLEIGRASCRERV